MGAKYLIRNIRKKELAILEKNQINFLFDGDSDILIYGKEEFNKAINLLPNRMRVK